MADKVNMNPPVPDIVRNYKNNEEYGRIGQKRYSGIFWEEFIPELRGRKGIEVYKEMAENDDVIGAILFAIENLIRQASFTVTPASEKPVDKRAAEFIESCMEDMSGQTWTDTISEVLSFLPYGWSVHEIVYKRRMGKTKNVNTNSKFEDGLIGWQKLGIRAQDTLWRWEYNEDDELVAMSQMAPPDYAIRTIPMEKCLHFRTKSRKNNPEGRSILRNSYRSYYFKKRLQEIEGIGIERDLAGLPVLHPPEGVEIWDKDDPEMAQYLQYAEDLVKNVRRDSKEGIVLPFGWDFQLMNGGSRRQFEVGSVIDRYDNRMAMTVLADFVMLGQKGVGSYALSSDKTEFFATAIGTYLDVICETFNQQGIPRLIDLNGDEFKGITDYPTMEHGDIEKPDITGMSTFIKDMVGIGLLTPDAELEDYVRELGTLPTKVEGAPMPGQEQQQPQQQQAPQEGQKQPENDQTQQGGTSEQPAAVNDAEDAKQAEVAKARLGRRRRKK
ncbi:MAG: hypothetical protein VB031_02245 [Eubacteriaceae bacterium]|nr:hypothetical protein [Eubacteriaceae bacterium]